MKKVSELKDGDVVPCISCGDLVTIIGIEEGIALAKAIQADLDLDKTGIMCDDYFKELNATHNIDLNNQMN